MCSTFKFAGGGAGAAARRPRSGVARSPGGDPRRRGSSPTRPPPAAMPAGHMTMGELCEAAVTLSDNSAANLMLESFGGPAGADALRALAWGTTSPGLDRIETDAQRGHAGRSARHHLASGACSACMRELLLGRALAPASRERLRELAGAPTRTGRHQPARPACPPTGASATRPARAATARATTSRSSGRAAPARRCWSTAYLTGATALDDAAQRRVLAEDRRAAAGFRGSRGGRLSGAPESTARRGPVLRPPGAGAAHQQQTKAAAGRTARSRRTTSWRSTEPEKSPVDLACSRRCRERSSESARCRGKVSIIRSRLRPQLTPPRADTTGASSGAPRYMRRPRRLPAGPRGRRRSFAKPSTAEGSASPAQTAIKMRA